MSRLSIILALGTAQTLAWASSYYLLAIIADAIARDLHITATAVFAAFSASLVLSALAGPRVGRTIDRFGGREVLAVSNILFAGGLALLAVSQSMAVFGLAWLVIGIAMGLGLYDAAFAALTRIYGNGARGAITGITLLAGFASTIGWPLTSWAMEAYGWRAACLGWAGAHLVVGLPLNLFVLPEQRRAAANETQPEMKPQIPMDATMWLLAFAFAAGWVVSTGMAAHLPRILLDAGTPPAQAIMAAALVGPGQVAARVAEASLLRHHHPLLSARLCTLAHPVGSLLLLGVGGVMAIPFTLLHGAGNGILTIARGTVPLAVFGQDNYGYRLGLLGAPARLAQAAAPLAFGLLIDRYGASTLVASSALCLAALAALLAVAAQTHNASEPMVCKDQ
ncbi:MAG: MFS transporter [Rhodomicrobium sp.]